MTVLPVHAQNVMLVIISRMALVLNVLLELMHPLQPTTNAQLVPMVQPLLLAQKLLLIVLIVLVKVLDVSLALQLLLANAQNAVLVMLWKMAHALNVLLELGQLKPPPHAHPVLQAKPPLLAQKLLLTVKTVLVRLMDVPHALIPMLVHAQNALLVMV